MIELDFKDVFMEREEILSVKMSHKTTQPISTPKLYPELISCHLILHLMILYMLSSSQKEEEMVFVFRDYVLLINLKIKQTIAISRKWDNSQPFPLF